MCKRLLWIGGLVLGLVVLGLVVVVIDRPPKPGVTPANFQRLHEGMSEKEAEAILGRPADFESIGIDSLTHTWVEGGVTIILEVSERWVVFSKPPKTDGPFLGSGRIHLPDGSSLTLDENPRESTLDQFRRWLGLK